MKRVLATIVVLCVLVPLFAACGNRPQDAGTGAPASQASGDEIANITIFASDNMNPDFPYSFTDRPALKKIADLARDEFKLNLSIETAINTEFVNVLNTRFASGNLPDVVIHRYDALRLDELYRNGLIHAISDYDIPNFQAFLDEVPYLKITNGSSDGKVLRFCEVFFNVSHITNGLNFRKDWLRELGMEAPTTTEELRAAVKAFQDNDMNGNGQPDEQLAFTDWRTMNFVLAPAFGVQKMTDAVNSWSYDSNNKVYQSMVTPEAKNYFEYINSLYSEGLIWDMFLNYRSEDYSAFKLANRYAGSCGRNWDGVLFPTEMNAYGITAENTPLYPITDGTRERASLVIRYGGSGGVMFTRDCSAVDRAIALWDHFFTIEGHQLRYFGEVAPGGEYYVKDDSIYASIGVAVAERRMVPTDRFRAESAELPDLRIKLGINMPIFPSGNIAQPPEVVAEYYFTYTPEVCGDSARLEYMVPLYEWHLKNGVYEIGLATATVEQSQIITDRADLFTYMDEQMHAFFTGVRSLNDWDDFVGTCERMGLAAAVEVQQERYDEFLRLMK